jgi:hypothetical protein
MAGPASQRPIHERAISKSESPQMAEKLTLTHPWMVAVWPGKQELDRLGAFKDYEDRFLDLFKKPEES